MYSSQPYAAAVRPGTASSYRPLLTAQQLPGKAGGPFVGIESRLPSHVESYRTQQPSITPKPPVLPIERGSKEFSEEAMAGHTSIPPYLQNLAAASQPKQSRFSWTNSQAPKTPLDNRFSVATSVSSVPRYRTVESWVGVQAGRLDNARLQDHLRQEIEKQIRNPVPSVPEIPPLDTLSRARYAPPAAVARKPPSVLAGSVPVPPPAESLRKPLPIPKPALKKNSALRAPGLKLDDARLPPRPQSPGVESAPEVSGRMGRTRRSPSTLRRKARHTSDATVFQVHPGTKVVLRSGTRVPSEILDRNILPKGAL